ncbi:Sac-like phosphoinositide polyphosphatase [Encephalitozoon hellem ATCC 50504]|uniref:Phosphoinositide polyphosphatase n=1 Tax=Encephalitozoon hellem TaxID=27973 RepID=A0ABY8CHB6_ENCHE|nr:Sac-like phosphoinositide polyphosphatase [Encephalitozoon hellem ATCC 50504]AFM98004.1 Sac-like phosphoinositide polyphosphatase [Encephalitozoon hellem ATCC 50504]WEL38267.1 phosphoinositide polyphosphatase [Encephalitozoon hellem]|eukprot:XP_003886985.1 Sac-like phosphoinositide polyphosphatase [Encephalitozoon hellem ATCC 50504]
MDMGINLKVTTSPEKVMLENITGGVSLTIERQRVDARRSICHSYGVYGIVTISKSSYLILVVDAIMRGMMHDHVVYEIKDVEIIQLKRGSSENFRNEMRAVRRFLGGNGVYFSTYPLYKAMSAKKDDDVDFLFNSLPLQKFVKHAGGQSTLFSIYCIQGFFGSVDVGPICLRLISRRSWRRTGARYFCRGSDTTGYVSNYVETEQIVYEGEKATSFLQVRGSIPLIWEHALGREYNPKIIISNQKVLHIADKVLRDKYGDVLYLNLIRSSGYEGNIHCAYKNELLGNNKKGVHFNFFEEGGIVQGSTREKFLGLIEEAVTSFGYHGFGKLQSGVIRTNCIDCLDRTNISQFVIGELMFEKQISHFNIESKEHLFEQLKNLWYKNGNSLSMQYSGSFALKSHFLSRREQGVIDRMKDGAIGLHRYFVNRLCHGSLQVTYEILTTDLEGKSISSYRDNIRAIKTLFLILVLTTCTASWALTGIFVASFFLSVLTISAITVAIIVVFLDFLIQKPKGRRRQ